MLPTNRQTLINQMRPDLPHEELFFNEEHFRIPLATIAMLEDISDIYTFPDPLVKKLP